MSTDGPGPRVVVTGLGAITAAGVTREQTWDGIVSGATSITEIRAWDCAPYRTRIAGEAHAFDPLAHFSKRRARRLDRCHQLAIVASREALSDAGLDLATADRTRIGVIIGTSLGGMNSGMRYDRELVRNGRYRPHFLFRYPFHVCVDELTAELKLLGPRSLISTACTASTVALGQAYDAIRTGQADVVLAGGVDPLSEFTFAGFGSMKNVSESPCAPFSEPIGLSIGEGAGMLILERRDLAAARGARIYAELLGYALAADAYHPTSPDPSGQSQKRVALEALRVAGVDPSEVDYVNAHGTGTSGNDIVETRALRMTYGERAAALPVSSIKGAVGHTLGAAGGVEALITVLAIQRDLVPPTANFTTPRAGCDLDYVPNQARSGRVSVAVSQNFAFGGNNAALVFAKPDRPDRRAPLPRRRVVITGLGLLTPIGVGRADFLAALRQPVSGVAPVTAFDAGGLGSRLAAEIPGFNAARLTRAETRRMDRLSQLTVCGAELALKDAELKATRETAERIGIIAGSSYGPCGATKAFHKELALGVPQKANPVIFPNTVYNAGVGLAAIHLRIRGCNVTLTIGQASGLIALGYAYDLVRQGAADALIAGGVDELDRAQLEGFAVAKMVSPHVAGGGSAEEGSRPFDRRRNGMVLGEGAGFVVLEALDSARARGAKVYGELLAYHCCADEPVVNGWDPSGEGMARAMRRALEMAGVAPAEVQHVSAAALSHPLHDRIEARALAEVFGPRGVPVAALSSRLGASGATGGIALGAALLGIQESFLPSGTGSEELDPECPVDLVTGVPRAGSLRTAVVNAASVGGTNCSVVVRRYDGD